MNDYDDSDDCSSANSFRARSNTWPLNRPDFAVPNTAICIEETLPEIDLEEDDLFTTNENWSTGFVDHDIMSWDPILSAQTQQQNQQLQAHTQHQQQAPLSSGQHQQTQATTIHHHHQPQQQQQQTHQAQDQLQQQGHQRQQSIHLQYHSHHHHNHQPQQQPHPLPHPQPQLQAREHLHHAGAPVLLGPPPPPPPPIPIAQLQQQQQHRHIQHQQQQHLPQHQQPAQHQTLNASHCLEPDDLNEYHVQQMHHLRLDSNPHDPSDSQIAHYVTSQSSLCIQTGSTASINNDSYTISPTDHQHHNQHHHHQQHHLQQLSSARHDFDEPNDYDTALKSQDDGLHALNHQQLDEHGHLQHHQQEHHQLNHNQRPQHHLHHHLTSSSLDNTSTGSHVLSSSLSTSGIGLSGDLEDLDYKGAELSSVVLPQQHFDDQGQLQQLDTLNQQADSQQTSESGELESKQSNSISTSKTKLNTPRRNAWGNMSYADLISQAINSTSDKRLTLSQIYDWMVQHVPYFKDKGDSNSSAGWKNSVRHNLSLHSRFKRLQNEGTGKSSWWTINPEANVGKCARRRAASMEASKYEKKRGRAKKRAEAIRQGLISYPSLTNSSLNGSISTLDQQQSQAQSLNKFQNQQPQNVQTLEQFVNQQPHTQQQSQLQHTIQTQEQYGLDQPSQQQQQHLQELQQSDRLNCDNPREGQPPSEQSRYVVASREAHYEGKDDKMRQQHQQQQQSQYYYQFELSTAL